ncbi:Hypothetical protein DPCES_3833 [Desulfitobacterium hafniense]|uniref:Uncharacterized protein n=1 Tax=Desulfitobacterium hafniense TaxID=49338 RepID=A0A098B4F4_DESHA|nr:hypothetical protein [Desulfitobacterium hafniense]CDX03719.1 Hypothetical protein DPCES_3833 [Desulfitobacterium hafniense]
MCFRPASASRPIECPNCGMKVPVVGGVKQKKCPKCKADLTQVEAKPEEKPEDEAGTEK